MSNYFMCLMGAFTFGSLVATPAFAQIESFDVQMASSSAGISNVQLEPLTFLRNGERDPREKVARKPFIGTLLFEKDHVIRVTSDGFEILKTTTSSCAVTAAYDPEILFNQGIYDVRGYTADHCVTEQGEIGFDRAIVLFPGAQKKYLLSPADFTPSRQTDEVTVSYAFDWATVSLPDDPELFAVPLHKGDYEGPVVFEASTKGYAISGEGKTTHYVATRQECMISRRYQDHSSDKVTTCRTAKAMSGGGFFVKDTGALYATLSRIGQETHFSYATLVASVGSTYNPQYEYEFQVAHYALRGKTPFGDVREDTAYLVADAIAVNSCKASDGTSLIDKLMLTGLSYYEARQLC